MAFGQRGLGRGLALQKPVQCIAELILIDLTEAEQFAEARRGGGRRQRTCGRGFGCRIEDPTDQQSEDEIAATIAVGAEDPVEADLAGGAECDGDVAVWRAADDGDAVAPGAPWLRTTARTADAMLSASQIASIRLLVMTGLSGSDDAVIASASLPPTDLRLHLGRQEEAPPVVASRPLL
jgi:hypothetical protein